MSLSVQKSPISPYCISQWSCGHFLISSPISPLRITIVEHHCVSSCIEMSGTHSPGLLRWRKIYKSFILTAAMLTPQLFVILYQLLISFIFILSISMSEISPIIHLKSFNAFWLLQFSASKYFVFLKYHIICYYSNLYLPHWMNSLLRYYGYVSLLCILFIASGSVSMG